MKKCSYCGAEAADDIKYCEQCERPFDAQDSQPGLQRKGG